MVTSLHGLHTKAFIVPNHGEDWVNLAAGCFVNTATVAKLHLKIKKATDMSKKKYSKNE